MPNQSPLGGIHSAPHRGRPWRTEVATSRKRSPSNGTRAGFSGYSAGRIASTVWTGAEDRQFSIAYSSEDAQTTERGLVLQKEVQVGQGQLVDLYLLFRNEPVDRRTCIIARPRGRSRAGMWGTGTTVWNTATLPLRSKVAPGFPGRNSTGRGRAHRAVPSRGGRAWRTDGAPDTNRCSRPASPAPAPRRGRSRSTW